MTSTDYFISLINICNNPTINGRNITDVNVRDHALGLSQVKLMYKNNKAILKTVNKRNNTIETPNQYLKLSFSSTLDMFHASLRRSFSKISIASSKDENSEVPTNPLNECFLLIQNGDRSCL